MVWTSFLFCLSRARLRAAGGHEAALPKVQVACSEAAEGGAADVWMDLGRRPPRPGRFCFLGREDG